MATISVRGAGRVETSPDEAHLVLHVGTRGASTAEVLAALRSDADRCVSLLEAAGAVLAAPVQRPRLGYMRSGVTVEEQTRWDQRAEEQVPTGSFVGTASVEVTVREWALLPQVLEVVAQGGSAVAMRGVEWTVDDDNPTWADVRALAVEDAVRRAEHYARAAGWVLGPLEQLADDGLSTDLPMARASMLGAPPGLVSGGGVPNLDPPTQVLGAAVEARFGASPAQA